MAQNTHWSSGELSAKPSRVTLMRLSPAPRIRIYVVPVPSPFSPQACTPGVRVNIIGSSRPVFENSCSLLPSMLEMAKGASFFIFTPIMIISLICSTFMVSGSTVEALLPKTQSIAAAVIIIFFIRLILTKD